MTKLKIVWLCVICGGLIACRSNGGAPTVEPSVVKPTIRPTATLSTLIEPTQPPSQGGLTSYDDPTAPFTMQYPAGWKAREEPESISFQSPDQTATFQVIIYEYPEGAPRTTTSKEIFDRLTQNFSLGTGLKIGRQGTRSDGSVSADIEFQDLARKSLQGYVRIVLAQNRRHHFIVLFTVDQNQFARYRLVGTTVIDSFRER